MKESIKHNLLWLGVTTSLAIGFGLFYGFLSKDFKTSFAISFSIAFTMHLFNVLFWRIVAPKFDTLAREKRYRFQIPLLLIVNLLGFFVPYSIAGKIVGFNPMVGKQLLLNLSVFFMIFLIITGLIYSFEFYRQLKQKEIKERELKELIVEAELKALKSQINPHFLFNTLNTISSLISTDPQKAEDAVEKLAEVFRYTLTATNKEFVRLEDELDFIHSYLDLEKIRFGKRLKMKEDIDPDTLDVLIPSLILQPLVENAIKHGIDKETGEVALTIVAHKNKKLTVIEISDRGPGFHPKNRGTGLKLVADRLEKLYGKEYGLEINNGEPNGTTAIIRIPENH